MQKNHILSRCLGILLVNLKSLILRRITMIEKLGYNPTATELYNEPKQLPFEQPGIRTETYSKLKNEGYLSSGEKISLEDRGYFMTDPIQYDDSFISSYVEYFSKNQIDEVTNAVTKTSGF